MAFAPIITVGPPASTVPANTPIAADTLPVIGAVQLLKVLDGRPGGTEGIPGDGTNGLFVNLKASGITGGLPVAINGVTLVSGALPVNVGNFPNPMPVSGTFWPTAPATEVGTVRLKDAVGNSLSSTGNALDVNLKASGIAGGLPVTFSGQVDTELPTPVAPGDGRTDTFLGSNLPTVQALGLGFNGTTTDRVRVGPAAGTQIPANTAGVLYIQGIGVAGAVPISGSITTTAGPGDDTAFTFGVGSTPVTPAGYVFDDATTHVLATEDRVAAARVNTNRAQMMVIEDHTNLGGTNRARVAGGSLQVSIGAIATIADNLNPQTGFVAGMLLGYDENTGNAWDRVRVSNAGSALPITTPGILGVQGVGGGVPLPVGGTAAHNQAVSGNPVNLGAQARTSEATALASHTNMVQLVADVTGKLIVLPYANPEQLVVGVSTALTTTTAADVIVAGVAGIRNYVTSITVTNASATATFVSLLDGAAQIWSGYAAANGGGMTVTFPSPLRGSPATAIRAACATAPGTGGVVVSASGYRGV